MPAKVAGTWQMPQSTLALTQEFQMLTGMLGSTAISGGRLRGDAITFTVGNTVYNGRVEGNTIRGTMTGGARLLPRSAETKPGWFFGLGNTNTEKPNPVS